MGKQKIWSGVLPLTVLVGLILGIFLLGRIGAYQNSKVEENGLETVGTTLEEGRKRRIKIVYNVNGISYEKGTSKPFSFIKPNEQFLVKYLPDDPESFVIFFDQPIISSDFEYLETKCISLSKTASVVEFKYAVRGETFQRNTLYRGHELRPDKYKVVYRSNDPDIGYLLLK